jgi:hypothetical protein
MDVGKMSRGMKVLAWIFAMFACFGIGAGMAVTDMAPEYEKYTIPAAVIGLVGIAIVFAIEIRRQGKGQ